MPPKQLSAGDYISSRCSKCKDVTNHTIVAMVGDKVVRVECNTCGGVHNYRGTQVVVKTKLVRPNSRPTAGRTSKAEEQWQALLNDADPATAVPYNLQTPVADGALIQHPSFGLGRVVAIIRPNKMEVYFQSGIKLLRCTPG